MQRVTALGAMGQGPLVSVVAVGAPRPQGCAAIETNHDVCRICPSAPSARYVSICWTVSDRRHLI